MDRTTHVVIVGAGVIGCSTAYELAGRGAKVQVIDRRAVGQGATQASAGVLAPLIGAHGNRELVDLGLRSLKLFDEFVARVIKDSGSAVQYVRSGTLEVAMNSNALGQLQALSRTCGARGVSAEYLDAKSVHEVEPQLSEKIRGGLLVGNTRLCRSNRSDVGTSPRCRCPWRDLRNYFDRGSDRRHQRQSAESRPLVN